MKTCNDYRGQFDNLTIKKELHLHCLNTRHKLMASQRCKYIGECIETTDSNGCLTRLYIQANCLSDVTGNYIKNQAIYDVNTIYGTLGPRQYPIDLPTIGWGILFLGTLLLFMAALR